MHNVFRMCLVLHHSTLDEEIKLLIIFNRCKCAVLLADMVCERLGKEKTGPYFGPIFQSLWTESWK